MREIKFRAWHLDDDANYFMDYMIRIFNEPGVSLNHSIQATDNLMQYTGLKDKNGNTSVEVYEGDIIDVDGKVKGNIYEMDAGETDLVIQGFGTKTWCKTYNEAISRGCYDSE